MKICVFSDSHGCPEPMIAALSLEQPALYFFLGDGARDLDAVRARFPSLPFFAVRGNCDLRSRLSVSLVCAVGGLRFFLSHGHLYDVKYEPELDSLAAAARSENAAAALFGHTHRQRIERRDGLLLFNPGSVGRNAEYGVLAVEDGTLLAAPKRLN